MDYLESPKPNLKMVQMTNDNSETLTKKSSLFEKTNDKVYSISNEFILRDSINLSIQNDHLLSRKREIFYNYNEQQNIIDFVYNSVHNCYFALRTDNSLALFNSNFQEVNRRTSKSGTILCMIFNPINDELITSTVEGFKLYTIKKDEKDRWKALIQMCNYSIILKQEFSFTDDWIKKLEIDIVNCHLYCCSSSDLYIFDFNWNLMRNFKKIHDQPITCVVYSPTSKVFITGSMDCEIKIWSPIGDLIERLKGHSKPVTKLVLNPYNSNIFLSSSLDGTIKMWSLDINQIIYEIDFDNREIFYIGLTEDEHLYVATEYDVSIWSINSFIDYWTFSQDRVVSLSLECTKGKSTQVITMGEEKTIRIFSRSKANQITSILPIPTNDINAKIDSIVYCRNLNCLYVFINNEIWIFYTKTYPCAKVSVWDANDIQKSKSQLEEDIIIEANLEALRRKTNYLVIQNLMRNHRAIEIGLGNTRQNEISKCRSIGFVESSVIFWNIEGPSSPITQNFLLLGLENGTILFCDPLIKDKKYFTLNCSKDPVVEIKHDKVNNYLITKIELINMYHIQYWSLPDLEFKHEIYCSRLMSSYARLDEDIMVGFEDGTLELLKLRPNMSKDLFNKALNEQEYQEVLKKSDKFEHRQKIEAIDVCNNLKLFMSCSFDGIIKIWSNTKKLLADISLDQTLSACCFLNSYGDLLVSWQKHLFKITMEKVIPDLKNLPKNDEYSVDEDEDDEVLDEPALRDETDQDLKIDLGTYLNPFNLKLTKEGTFVFDQFKLNKNKKQKNYRQLENRIDEFSESFFYGDTSNQEIIKTSVPHSLLSTPRENPLNSLQSIDLTLNNKFNQAEIHEYLVEILLEYQKSERKNSFPKNWNVFPKFGKSPTGTPERTPPEVTPRSDDGKKQDEKLKSVSEIDQKNINETQENIQNDQVKIKNKKLIANEKQSEMEKKLADLLPNYDKNKLNDTKQISRDFHLPTSSQSKSTNTKQTNTLEPSHRFINKRKSNVNKKASKKLDQTETDESDQEELGKISKKAISKSVKTKFDSNRIKPVSTKNSSANLSANKSNENIIQASNLNSSSKKTILTQDLSPLDPLGPLDDKRSIVNNSRDVLDLDDKTENELIGIKSANTSHSFFKKSQLMQNEEENLMRTKNLFEYLYIKPVLPKRVGSGAYVLALENKNMTDFKKPELRFDENFIEDVGIQDDFSKDAELSKSKYFMDWLKNYENQRKSLNDRLNKVRSNHDAIMKDNLKKWSDSVRKKSAVSKQQTCVTRSALAFVDNQRKANNNSKFESKSEVTMKQRPKSVTFNRDKPDIVHIQPAYLVSQLEMEEIIKEVNDRLGDKLSSVSFKEHVEIESDSDYETLNGFGSKEIKRTSSESSQKVKFNDSQTDHRLKLSSHSRSIKSGYIQTIDSDYEILSDKEEKVENKNLVIRKRVKTASSNRSRTPSSIPSKRKFYGLFEYPEINLEFQMPDSPEKYLLPIRFPILYNKIIKSLSKVKLEEYSLRNRKFFINRTKVL